MRSLDEIFRTLPSEEQEALRGRTTAVLRRTRTLRAPMVAPGPASARRPARPAVGPWLVLAAAILGILALTAGLLTYTIDEVRFLHARAME